MELKRTEKETEQKCKEAIDIFMKVRTINKQDCVNILDQLIKQAEK